MSTARKAILFVQAGPALAMRQAVGGFDSIWTRYRIDYAEGTLTPAFSSTPLPIATLGALTPPEFDVAYWDENLDGPIGPDSVLPHAHYDVVGISVMFSYVKDRVPTLAKLFQARGAHVAAGGPGVSTAPHEFRGHVDTLFVNEAEYTWPRFLADFVRGEPQAEYVQIEKPDMRHSPAPRWDVMDARITEYNFATVQTTRGCPFDCEFCDVIYLFGRAQRHKSIEQVMGEVRALHAKGGDYVFFTDDEFIGNLKHAKPLLREVIAYNKTLAKPIAYCTQATLNLSRDDELLALMADANFRQICIGVESLSAESLRGTNKLQNVRADLIGDIHHILSFGLPIIGSFIVGFDEDGPDVFERTVAGIEESAVPIALLHRLSAPEGTPLWARYKAEGRLVKLKTAVPLPELLNVNFMPKLMTRAELLEGWRWAARRLSSWDSICKRLRAWAALVTRPPEDGERQIGLDGAIRALRSLDARRSLAKADLALAEETFAWMADAAPHLMNRALYCAITGDAFARSWSMVPDGVFNAIVGLEKAGGVVPDATPLVVPPSFRAAFDKLFPAVYARLFLNLPSRDLIPRAASEVFVDFLIRWGAELASGPVNVERDLAYLVEICDRTCAKATGRPPSEFVPAESGPPVPMAEVKRARLGDAVLKDIGDRMMSLSTSTGA